MSKESLVITKGLIKDGLVNEHRTPSCLFSSGVGEPGRGGPSGVIEASDHRRRKRWLAHGAAQTLLSTQIWGQRCSVFLHKPKAPGLNFLFL